MYTWLSEWQFKECSHSKDKDIDEVLQEVRKISPIYYVQERQIRKGFFKSKIETFYTLYEATGTEKDMEVRFQSSVRTKSDLLNFLYGLNIGLHFKK